MSETSNNEYIDDIVQKMLDRHCQHVDYIQKQMQFHIFFFSIFLALIVYFFNNLKDNNFLITGTILATIIVLYLIIAHFLLKNFSSSFEKDLSDLRLESDLKHIAKTFGLEIFFINDSGNRNYFLIGPLTFKIIIISNNGFSFEINDLINIVKNVDDHTFKLAHGEYIDTPITKIIDFINIKNISAKMSGDIKDYFKRHKFQKLF